jgi:hypothetical protein
MRIIHGLNYTDTERKRYKPVIIQNIIESIVRLVEALKLFSLCFESKENDENFNLITKLNQNLKSDMSDWNVNAQNYRQLIEKIWKDNSIKTVFNKKNKFYISDSIEL